MAHLLHDFLAEENPQHDSQVVGRHNQSDDLVLVTLEPHIDAQQAVHQTASHGENGRGDEQCHEWSDNPDHYELISADPIGLPQRCKTPHMPLSSGMDIGLDTKLSGSGLFRYQDPQGKEITK